MFSKFRPTWATRFCLITLLASLITSVGFSQDDKVANALKISPKHDSVDYDIPNKDDAKACKIEKANESTKLSGWIVKDASNRTLRQFLDNNGDGKLDQWSYFKDGSEVYRDIDANFDGKTDQYRWLGSAGIRWGLDPDQDGKIDRWKIISAEEVAQEIFHAIKSKDEKRFSCLIISGKELASLSIGKNTLKSVEAKLQKTADFKKVVSSQNEIKSSSEYSGFGTGAPSLIPEGSNGIGKDIIVYDHASAMFKTGENYGQVAIGTIVQVEPNLWRVIELPQLANEGMAVVNGGVFSTLPTAAGNTQRVASSEEAEMFTKLFERLDKVEKQIKVAKKDSEIYKLEKERVEIMKSIVENSDGGEDKRNWIRSLTDLVADAYRRDHFPDGLDYLGDYLSDLKKDGAKSEDVDYIQWRIVNARWSKGLDLDRQGREKANDVYYEELEAYVSDFPKSEFSAQAMAHLANNYEINQEDDEAINWYKKLARSFPEETEGKRAEGALTRLTSEGKKIKFNGKTLDGRSFDLSRMSGKVVVIHYWDTNCELCIDGFDELKRLNAKYKNDLLLVGANLDQTASTAKKFLGANKSVNWPQLWMDGGGEASPLALQLGVSVMPTLILIDQEGRLVESNLPVSDLDREIQRLQKRNAKR